MPKHVHILVLFLLFLYEYAGAQTQGINFTSLSSKEGLLSNSVNAILKDRYGLMWFATDDGLNKFDGTNFTVYRYQPGDSLSLRSNEILALHEDRSGNLWIGTSGGGLSLYDRRKNVFVNYPVKNGPLTITSNDVIRGIGSDYRGRIWIAQFGGLYMLDPATQTISKQILRDDTGRPVKTNLTGLYIDSKQRLWITTDSGLFLYAIQSNSFRQYEYNPADPSSLTVNKIKSVTEDKWGNIWVGTTAGLSRLKPDGAGFTHYDFIRGVDIYCITGDSDGMLWIGTGHGLYVYNIETNSYTVYTHENGNAQSISSEWIRCAYIDREGIYWFGTFRGGISKYDKNLNLFNLRLNSSFQSGTNPVIINAMTENKNGHVLFGTDGKGLFEFDRHTGIIRPMNIRLNGTPAHSLSIMALHRSQNNELYIGCFTNGLFIYDQASGASRHFVKGNGPNSLTGNDIFSIFEDSRGNIWVGTNGEGVNVLNSGKVVARYTPQPGGADEALLPINGYIRAIEEDANGNIWIGTHGGGIAVLQPSSGKWTLYNQENSQLLSNKITCLYRDRRGRMWVGTFGGGLAAFDQDKHSFVSFTEQEGLQNTMIYQVVEDRESRLWISTNTGITCFDPVNKHFRNFTTQNGLQNANFVRGSGLELSDGELIFGGLQGFNHFYPGRLTVNRYAPNVILTDLKIYNRPVVAGSEAPIKDHISIANEIRLNYKQNFSLNFVALNYTISKQNHYAYKLEGFDKDWNYAGTTTTASYTNLDPGEYTFHVKASNNDGIWSPKDTTIKIYVKPPFWRTSWAYVFYILAIGGLLLYSRYRGLSKLRRKFAIEQERQHVKRTQELDRLKLQFLTNLSHDFRTPISLIMGPVEQLIDAEGTPGKLDKLNMIRRNARRLLNLVNQLLDFRKMEEHELNVHLTRGDFIAFLKEVTESFKDLSERKNIHFSFKTCIDRLDALFDRDKIERILFNLLSNAFKFTPGGGNIVVDLQKAEHSAEQDCTWVTLKVADTGTGISEEKKELIFNRFFQDEANPLVLNQGSGIGLAITKEFVKIHGGKISVESEPGKGCIFTIQIPLKRAKEPAMDTIAPATSTVTIGETAAHKPAAITHEANDLLPVLLVEDNEDFRFYLKDNLRNHYRVIEAANGKEGWQKALSHHPHLIVSDISMPEMDGIALVNKLKADKRTSHIPIILLTAISGQEQQIRGLETGANDYITKPFNFEVLNVKMKNLLHLNNAMKSTYTRHIKMVAPELKVESPDEKLLHDIVTYLEKNISNPQLSVETLSKQLGMSRGTLYVKLLDLTGQTPVEYIRSFRLDKAAVLMEKTNMTIAEIAYQVGFTTPNYFARSFKSKFNMAPSEYIAGIRKEGPGNSN